MIIHQIWLQGPENIPLKYIKYIDSIKTMNPKYKHYIWSEKSFIEEFPEKNNILQKMSLIHLKVDYMRYVILYYKGGIYVDVDVEALQPFDSLLEGSSKFSLESCSLILSKIHRTKIESLISTNNTFIVNNGIMIAKTPNIYFLGVLINNVEKYIENPNKRFFSSDFQTINEITGPKMVTNAYINLPEDKKKEIILLDPEYFEPCNGTDCNYTKNSILSHRQDMTWMPLYIVYMNRYYTKLRLIGPVSILLLLILFRYFRETLLSKLISFIIIILLIARTI